MGNSRRGTRRLTTADWSDTPLTCDRSCHVGSTLHDEPKKAAWSSSALVKADVDHKTRLPRCRARAWFVQLWPYFILHPDPGADPQLSTAKRQQRTQALNSTLSQAALERKLAAAEATRVQLETRLRERDATIERLEADRRWLAEREQEEREEKERVSKEREDEKVRKQRRNNDTIETDGTLKTKADQDARSLRSELSTLKEDYADLQDKLDALSHSTSQKLAAQAAELTSREHQVVTLTAELRASQDAAAAHSAEALRLQSALDSQAAEQADLSRRDAEEASWSVLRAELTRQAEHTRQLETAHTRAMAELGTLRERHTAIEVLREQNRALERRAAGADELRETVVRLEAEVQAARTERETWCVLIHPILTSH